MTNRIAAVDGGTSYHINALNDPAWADLIAERLYLPALGEADLSAFDILIVTCRSRPDLLARHRRKLADFIDKGGWLVACGETRPDQWLDGVRFTPTPLNYWWWLTPGEDHGFRLAAPDHPLANAIPFDDMIWHHHGLFTPPPDAISILEHKDGGSLIYDRPVGAGRTTIMAIDPFFHHGSFFMPAATRFLKGFMPWLATARPPPPT